MARPSEFSQETADIICSEIAAGRSVRSISQDDGMPTERTVYRWLRANEAFCQEYVRAREEQAELYADEIIEIVDGHDDPQRARLRMDARKWIASKLLPKKYGDRTTQIHEGGDKPVQVEDLTETERARTLAFILANGAQQAQ